MSEQLHENRIGGVNVQLLAHRMAFPSSEYHPAAPSAVFSNRRIHRLEPSACPAASSQYRRAASAPRDLISGKASLVLRRIVVVHACGLHHVFLLGRVFSRQVALAQAQATTAAAVGDGERYHLERSIGGAWAHIRSQMTFGALRGTRGIGVYCLGLAQRLLRREC